ncbi:predicted protein [Nematostella vectensis]|uniref:Uncharacterized protein n=1 Tax=Nematostella vectensis TaxID=45351 RepID=A7RXN9_NEMVE|nr:predicted protein [Nematostella vectensis]|eukprot:XP_001635872.1 predicted protein [Nematostella vectensis]
MELGSFWVRGRLKGEEGGVGGEDNGWSWKVTDGHGRACLGIGISFVVSSIVISAKAIHTLVINEEPKRSINLLFVSGTSVFLLFSMAYIKYLVAYKTDSRALRIDAFNTTAGGVMAFAVTLTSILYEHSNKIWFLDATVALGISLVFFLYGVRTIIELHSDKGTPVPSK